MKRMLIPLAIVALAALALAAPAVQAKGGTIIALKASSAFPGAKGKAKFQVEGQRELEIEVEHVRRLAGKRVNFFVNAKKVGSLRINGFGAAAAQPPRLPRPGSPVRHADQRQDRGRHPDRLGPLLTSTPSPAMSGVRHRTWLLEAIETTEPWHA